MNMLSIGAWVDILRPVVPVVPTVLWLQIGYLTLIMGFGTPIYVGVDTGHVRFLK
jgi:hypothetical protein